MKILELFGKKLKNSIIHKNKIKKILFKITKVKNLK